jgi:RNA polymerase sigma factor (TIGR02999 family)
MPLPEEARRVDPSLGDPGQATLILGRLAAGDASAAGELLPMVYAQLRAAAARAMASERRDHTLQPTALVHEAYLKLLGPRETPWAHRAHFYTAAAEAMRQILIDHARGRARHKRGGGAVRRAFDENLTAAEQESAGEMDFVALDGAICRLEVQDPRAAQVVRLKFYAGLKLEQIAAALGLSERTIKNDWAFARAWLERDLRDAEASS